MNDKSISKALENEDVRAKVFLRIIMKRIEDGLDAIDAVPSKSSYNNIVANIAIQTLEECLELTKKAEKL